MRAAGVAVAAICLCLTSTGVGAAEQAAAAACSACHSTRAKVETPVPRLVGRKPADIVAAMQAFRAGSGNSTVMDRIAKGFSEDEVKAIAAWYGAQKD